MKGSAGQGRLCGVVDEFFTAVTSRSHASEVIWRLFSSQGYVDATGRTGSDVRKILGSKAGTYNWDEAINSAGRIAGHGVDNVHGELPHVQIHLETGELTNLFPKGLEVDDGIYGTGERHA